MLNRLKVLGIAFLVGVSTQLGMDLTHDLYEKIKIKRHKEIGFFRKLRKDK